VRTERVGFAICGSFCTHERVLRELERLCGEYESVVPIVSETVCATDTRFGAARELLDTVERLTGRKAVSTIREAEPIGPKKLLDVLVVAPCTGNTLGKLSCGITDTAVTMAVKAHLRNERPVVLAVASNDGLSGAARNLGELLVRKNIYFVPFGQDDPAGKPCSLVADFSRIGDTVRSALEGRQLQPLLLRQ